MLSSPITLLVVAGAGFAIGQFSKRKGAELPASCETASARPSIFAMLMDGLTLTGTVMALLPAMRRKPASDIEAAGETP